MNMPVLQHYYTSFVNKRTGNAGFQVMAMSPGLTSEQQIAISRLIAYRIPSSLDERAIKNHPIALRYLYKDAQECIFLCSQSNGSDENGRPGNFFAHSLVLEPHDFTKVPAIFYWRSSFWCKKLKDPDPPTVLPSFPSLTSFGVRPELDLPEVWEFLAFEKRQEQFYKLMCAVIHASKARRRIIIIDNHENVARWIAAISCMLPPQYRPMLSFATYHHDPYQTPFLITGTTSDSSFRASVEEYRTYFILNAETGQISDVAESSYANIVASITHANDYEERLVPFFMDYAHRFPPITGIDEQLDQMASYAKLLEVQHYSVFGTHDVQAIQQAISALEQLRVWTEEDLHELKQLRKTLSKPYREQKNAVVQSCYHKVIQLLQKQNIPPDEWIMDDLLFYTEALVHERDIMENIFNIKKLSDVYGEEILLKCINDTGYLQYLDSLLAKPTVPQLQLVWKYIGPYLRTSPQSQGILLKSLSLIGKLWNEKRAKEGNLVFDEMTIAIQGHEYEWLAMATKFYAKLPNATLEHFYRKLVFHLELDERPPYRSLMQPLCPNITRYEQTYDIVRSIGEGQSPLLKFEQWVKHARQRQIGPAGEVARLAVSELQELYDAEQFHKLAAKILVSSASPSLPVDVEQELMQNTFSGLSFSTSSLEDEDLYIKYQHHPSLSDHTKMMITAILAMFSGDLNVTLTRQLYAYVKTLSPETYHAEVSTFISIFLKANITNVSHQLMISALFSWKVSKADNDLIICFWEAYWQALLYMLIETATVRRGIEILSYWFAMSPADLNVEYIIQKFLLDLPYILDNLQTIEDFHKVAPIFMTIIEKYQWYPCIEAFLPMPKGMLSTVSKNVFTRVQGLLPNQHTKQTNQERIPHFEAKVKELFDAKKWLEYHRSDLPKLYSLQRREQFWSYYWEQMFRLLEHHKIEQVLDLLSFWFDAAFTDLEQVPYVWQDFLLGLPGFLQGAWKLRAYQKLAKEIDKKGLQDRYKWYGLIQRFVLAPVEHQK